MQIPADASAGEILAAADAQCERRKAEARAGLERELAVIDRLGFADYFLILHAIVAWTRGRGIPVVARGSAAGS